MECLHCEHRRILYTTENLQCYCNLSLLQRKITAETVDNLMAPDWCPLKDVKLNRDNEEAT